MMSFTRKIMFSFLFLLSILLVGCGRAYFPLELKTVSRTERDKSQQKVEISLVPMTNEIVRKANQIPYKRQVISRVGEDYNDKPLPLKQAIVENLPVLNDPGPYKIGVGDEFIYSQDISIIEGAPKISTRKLIVGDDGYLTLLGLGRIKAEGLTQYQLEDEIIQKNVDQANRIADFELFISKFRSKKILVSISNFGGFEEDGVSSKTTSIPYTNVPIYLQDLFPLIPQIVPNSPIFSENNLYDRKIAILRGNKIYTLSHRNTLENNRRKIRLFPDDKVFVTPLFYRPENIVVVGETAQQKLIPISGEIRATLSDIVFRENLLINNTTDFSQFYVIRNIKNKTKAYHLDISNPARISIAKRFEMRPDDIVFVATQPLSLYSRTLSQILGSTGLTLQARDTIRTEIGN